MFDFTIFNAVATIYLSIIF